MARNTAASKGARAAQEVKAPTSAAPAKTAARPARPAAKAGAAAKAAVKPVPKAAVKPALKAVAKPAPKPAARAASKPVSKPASKPASTPVAKPVAKAARAAAGPARAIKDVARKLAVSAAPRTRAVAQPVETRAEAVRPQLVRDSFTMPEQEYAVLGAVKQACLKAGFEVKKSELLRIGVALLGQLDMASLRTVLASLPQLKTGRPASE
jgi:hypothetical protein